MHRLAGSKTVSGIARKEAAPPRLGHGGPDALSKPGLVLADPLQCRRLAVGAPIQRLTGFEVETQIPVYDTSFEGRGNVAAAKKWDPSIGYFLFSGMPYGYVGTDPGGRFQLHADHNDVQTGVSLVRAALIAGGLLVDDASFRNMANLEYVSVARDELGEGGDEILHGDRAAMVGHMKETLPIAQGDGARAVPGSSKGVLTGVPRTAILTWVDANEGNTGFVGQRLKELLQMIDDRVYVQQTSGVLPEDVPLLYHRSAKSMGESKDSRERAAAALLAHSVELAVGALKGVEKKVVTETIGGSRGAVLGLLTLAASRLLADSISFTDFARQPKNLLPHLPKTHFTNVFKALPPGVREEAGFWKAALGLLAKNAAKAFGPVHWVKTYGFEQVEKKSQLYDDEPGDHTKALKTLLSNVGTEDYPIEGELKPNLSLDDPHPMVASETKQKAVPLEDRYFGAKSGKPVLRIGDVDSALRTGVARSRGLVGRHASNVVHDYTRNKNSEAELAMVRFEPLLARLRSFEAEATRQNESVELEARLLKESIREGRDKVEEEKKKLVTLEKDLLPFRKAIERMAEIKILGQKLSEENESKERTLELEELQKEYEKLDTEKLRDAQWAVEDQQVAVEDYERFVEEDLEKLEKLKVKARPYDELGLRAQKLAVKFAKITSKSGASAIHQAANEASEMISVLDHDKRTVDRKLDPPETRTMSRASAVNLLKTKGDMARYKGTQDVLETRKLGKKQAEALEQAKVVWTEMNALAASVDSPKEGSKRLELFAKQLERYKELIRTAAS